MTNLAENLSHKRDLVLACGQSNLGAYGDFIDAWPQRERLDPSVGFASIFLDGGTWSNLSRATPTHNSTWTKGTLCHSLGGEMRAIGLRPSIAPYWVGGARSDVLLGLMSTIAPWLAQKTAELVGFRTIVLVWHQGETDFIEDTAAQWQANTEASIAAVRAAVGIPTLHVIVVQLPISYSPTLDPTHIPEVRAAQAALVASDPYSSLVCVESVVTVTNNIHWSQNDQARLARLLASTIKSL